ncbi:MULTISPECIES: PE domain-containing protein [Mycobacterium]|uniref:PE domain-containing protein n=1 Tax=Mycobacterium kiyosense TaxID=2871094 RepID=A0A9P3QAH3_9MYCO|nr:MULTISPECIES: PE domain-containing protein [Mycobacterium]BDB44643.1 hypothetical protein IWGMT90018_50890 [Mycobacterium kiyosense]BDE16145.1 hypothetical protein MKCMC460_50050 [Mycobacterium sp. 20KCMC460]GLB82184.1 hypothetical protein SRL2020028_14400 [Mycobacterium kiyosense]GLB91630.1 hypothetical protein SRL2020130_44470 [Mycobacterium kiyosense]GLB95326.1 hypothetical protein SRL2020226_21020 [Mycobacterium kiyosense]
MSFVGVVPAVVGISASQVADIGTAVNQARALAAIPTTEIAAAAQDEVSAAIASLFAGHGQQYQFLSQQVAALQSDFAQVLHSSAGVYAAAEASNASLVDAVTQNLISAINTPAELLLGHPLIKTGPTGAAKPQAAQASAAVNGSDTNSTNSGTQTSTSTGQTPTLASATTGQSGTTSGTGSTGGSAAAGSGTGGAAAGSSTTSATQNPVVATVPVDGATEGIVASPNGRYVYVANYDAGTVSVIDTTTKAVTATLPVGINPREIIVSPDGSHVYVSGAVISDSPGYQPTGVVSINTATNAVGSPAMTNYTVDPVMAITPDGNHLYLMEDTNNNVLVLNTATNTFAPNPILANSPFDMVMTPDGKSLYVSTRNYGELTVINTATDTASGIGLGPGYTEPSYLAMSPDGAHVYVETASSAFGITTIDTATNAVVGTPAPISNAYNGFATLTISPDGHYIYVPDPNLGTVTVFDTATNSAGTPITIGDGNFASVSRWGTTVSSDGHYVFIPGPGGINVLDTATNALASPIPVDWGQTGLAGGGGPHLGVTMPNGLIYLSEGLGTNHIAVIDPAVVSSNSSTGGTGGTTPPPTTNPSPTPPNILTLTEQLFVDGRHFLESQIGTRLSLLTNILSPYSGDVQSLINSLGIAFDPSLSPADKIVAATHGLTDVLGGVVKNVADHSAVGYLTGVAIQQTGDVANLVAQNVQNGNFTVQTFTNTVDYTVHHPAEAIRAAEDAVANYVPKLISNLLPKPK